MSANPTDNRHTGIEPVKLPTKCPEGGHPTFQSGTTKTGIQNKTKTLRLFLTQSLKLDTRKAKMAIST